MSCKIGFAFELNSFLSVRVGLNDFLSGGNGECEIKRSLLFASLFRLRMNHSVYDRADSFEYKVETIE